MMKIKAWHPEIKQMMDAVLSKGVITFRATDGSKILQINKNETQWIKV